MNKLFKSPEICFIIYQLNLTVLLTILWGPGAVFLLEY